MNKMKRAAGVLAAVSSLSVAVWSHQAAAQDGADSQLTELKAQTERLNAETARINAEAARTRARIDALNLPSFEGRTTLGTGGGTIESTLMAGEALRTAAETIRAETAQSEPARPILILAGDEVLDFSRAGAISAEILSIRTLFDSRLGEADERRALAARQRTGQPDSRPTAQAMVASADNPARNAVAASAVGGPAALIGAVSSVAGLLRSETELTGVDIQAFSHRMLASAVAQRYGDARTVIVPSAATGPVPADGPGHALLQGLLTLARQREQVRLARDEIPADRAKPTDAEKDVMAPYTAAIARFDAFYTRATSADDKGVVPVVAAARLQDMWGRNPVVLRVYVDRAGGSFVNSRNLLTTLALTDPVRVSGGLVTSFMLTDPGTGIVLKSGVLNCRTAVTRLRNAQRGQWDRQGGDGRFPTCAPIQARAGTVNPTGS